jgi:threonine 3-dehydrogenase
MECLRKDDLHTDGLTWTDVPEPDAEHGEVKIKVLAASVCGTDKSIYLSTQNPAIIEEMQRYLDRPEAYRPVIIGHEFCGIVEEVGEDVEAGRAVGVDAELMVEKGDYVTAEMHIPCGHCALCRRGDAHICVNVRVKGVHADGCYAQYVVVPRRNVIVLGKRGDLSRIPPRVGAMLDALGNAIHTIQVAEVGGKSVAILGLGPLGLMATLLARICGAARIHVTECVDVAHRFELARAFGADFCFDVAHSVTDLYREVRRREREAQGVDVVLEMSGSPSAYRDAFELVRNGGTVVLLGIPREPLLFDFANFVVWKGVTIKGVFGRRMFDTWEMMLKLLRSDRWGLTEKLSWLLAPRAYRLGEYEEAFRTLLAGEAMKLIFTPNPGDFSG